MIDPVRVFITGLSMLVAFGDMSGTSHKAIDQEYLKAMHEIESARTEVVEVLDLPKFVLSPPPEHYAGVSKPSKTLQEARQSAIRDASFQILTAIGARYNVRFSHDSLMRGRTPRVKVTDSLRVAADWFMADVSAGIVDSEYWQVNGNQVFFVLVHYPNSKMEKMRMLSRGPTLKTRLIKDDGKIAVVEVTETSGVAVRFDTATLVKVRHMELNRLLKTIFYDIETRDISSIMIPITPFKVKNSSHRFEIRTDADLDDTWRVGELEVDIALSGKDDIGRFHVARTKVR